MHTALVVLLVAGYALLAFIGPFLTVPLMRRQPLPKRIPKMLADDISRIEKESKTPHEYLKGCTEYILSQNAAMRFGAAFYLHLAYETDVKTLLKRRGYMHGHHLNHLLRLMIAKSSRFTDDDVRLRYSVLNLALHQYVQVRVAGQWYDVDLVGVSRGLPLGKHAWGFR